jgi:hypothetical protein
MVRFDVTDPIRRQAHPRSRVPEFECHAVTSQDRSRPTSRTNQISS